MIDQIRHKHVISTTQTQICDRPDLTEASGMLNMRQAKKYTKQNIYIFLKNDRDGCFGL